jgi:hypothetical protein
MGIRNEVRSGRKAGGGELRPYKGNGNGNGNGKGKGKGKAGRRAGRCSGLRRLRQSQI